MLTGHLGWEREKKGKEKRREHDITQDCVRAAPSERKEAS